MQYSRLLFYFPCYGSNFDRQCNTGWISRRWISWTLKSIEHNSGTIQKKKNWIWRSYYHFFFLTAILAPTHLLHGSYSSVLMRLHHHSIDLLIFLKKDTYIYATRTHAYPHTNMSAHILQNLTYVLDNLGVKVKNMNFNTRGTCLQVKLMMKLYE